MPPKGKQKFGVSPSRKMGKNYKRGGSEAKLNELRVPNPFNDWVEQNNIDLVALAIQTGINPPRLHALRTGLVVPHLTETVRIEQITAGGFTMLQWLSQPAVHAELQKRIQNSGKPMTDWLKGRMSPAPYLHETIRAQLKRFCLAYAAEVAAEEQANPPPQVAADVDPRQVVAL